MTRINKMTNVHKKGDWVTKSNINSMVKTGVIP